MTGFKIRLIFVGAFFLLALARPGWAAPLRADIFPGECRPEISDAIIRAYNHALNREYEASRKICEQLERDYPDHPAGSAGMMALFQVMMLENEDYSYDAELKAAAIRNQEAVDKFLETAPKNSWYYTLTGASWGIQGIYYLRRDEYLMAFYRGINALRFLNKALAINPDDWEARMGLGVFLYYRSAYSSFLPFLFPDQRAEGIREVEQAGVERPYLHEVSQIALYYIYLNQKDYGRCLAIMEGLAKQRPEFVIYYQFGGRAMMVKGDDRGALTYYRRIHELDPSLYLPLFKMGECHFRLGDDVPSKTYLERFLKEARSPDPSYTDSARDYLHRIQDRSKK